MRESRTYGLTRGRREKPPPTLQKASLWQIKAPFEVPEEALMAIELQEGSLDNVSGVIEYPSVFFE